MSYITVPYMTLRNKLCVKFRAARIELNARVRWKDGRHNKNSRDGFRMENRRRRRWENIWKIATRTAWIRFSFDAVIVILWRTCSSCLIVVHYVQTERGSTTTVYGKQITNLSRTERQRQKEKIVSTNTYTHT